MPAVVHRPAPLLCSRLPSRAPASLRVRLPCWAACFCSNKPRPGRPARAQAPSVLLSAPTTPFQRMPLAGCPAAACALDSSWPLAPCPAFQRTPPFVSPVCCVHREPLVPRLSLVSCLALSAPCPPYLPPLSAFHASLLTPVLFSPNSRLLPFLPHWRFPTSRSPPLQRNPPPAARNPPLPPCLACPAPTCMPPPSPNPSSVDTLTNSVLKKCKLSETDPGTRQGHGSKRGGMGSWGYAEGGAKGRGMPLARARAAARAPPLCCRIERQLASI